MGTNGPASENSSHLSDEQLAQFQDGELSLREAGHVKSCPQCGSRLNDLQSARATYAEYVDSIRAPLLPPVPKPWLSLNTLITRRVENHPPKGFRWWPALALAATLCIAVAMVVLYEALPRGPVEQSSIRATELLTRSSRVELPQGHQISMRVHGRTLIRPAVLTNSASPEREAGMADVQMVFASAHYSWREPLSGRSFQTWRSGLSIKRDSVSVVHGEDDKESYRVRTDSPSGVLRSASLTLRAADLRPTDGVFEFDGLGTVEVADAGASAERASPYRSSKVPSPGVSSPIETLASPEDTLHVLAALEKIGADVGEPIDISLDAQHRHVIVHANGLSTDRQQQITEVLKPLPRVVLTFDSRGSIPRAAQSAAPEKYSTNIPVLLRQQFEDRLGGTSVLQEVTDRVLDASGSALAQAHAVEVLARNFPPETEIGLTAQDQELLRALRESHISELSRMVAQIRAELKPLISLSAGAPSWQAKDNGVRIWQAGVPFLVASVQGTDILLNRLLAGSYSQSAGEEMLRGLAAQIEQLEWTVQSQQQIRR